MGASSKTVMLLNKQWLIWKNIIIYIFRSALDAEDLHLTSNTEMEYEKTTHNLKCKKKLSILKTKEIISLYKILIYNFH